MVQWIHSNLRDGTRARFWRHRLTAHEQEDPKARKAKRKMGGCQALLGKIPCCRVTTPRGGLTSDVLACENSEFRKWHRTRENIHISAIGITIARSVFLPTEQQELFWLFVDC